MPELASLYQNADDNYYYASHLFAALAKKGEAKQSMSHVGISIYQFNNAFPNTKQDNIKEYCQKADQFFGQKPYAYQIVVKEPDEKTWGPELEQSGYRFEDRIPAMLLKAGDLTKLPKNDSALDIQTVENTDQLNAYRMISCLAFSIPDFIGERVFTQAYLDHPAIKMYIGYVEEEPVTAALRVDDPSLASQPNAISGIYWVGTHPQHQNHGYGARITHHASLQAIKEGYPYVSLQASEMGRPVYNRLGYASTAYYHRYVKVWDQP